jgi:hypothetical protein
MAKLSDTQLVLLSNAAKRDDGALVLPPKLKGATADEAVVPLLSRKLCKAVPKAGQLPLWKRGPNDEPLSLVITPKGLAVIGVEPEGKPADANSPVTLTKRHASKSTDAKTAKAKISEGRDEPSKADATSKQQDRQSRGDAPHADRLDGQCDHEGDGLAGPHRPWGHFGCDQEEARSQGHVRTPRRQSFLSGRGLRCAARDKRVRK